ncbi:MAG: ShlB/FhaC/HecB family hemolysin secretion/activation protein, partial [Burkholderiaceae bacterium]|nr:ShlB/FhaC/HecB family hemolysin secretion/activation protein [Burkholderiaceae bacterium]
VITVALNKQLQDAGHATSHVSLPQQSLASGMLELQVSVGRVESIALADSGNPTGAWGVWGAWGTWRNAFPVSEGDVLDVHALEQGLEQMKRLPSQRVSTRLEPGAQPDTTRVVIEREPMSLRERIRGSIGLDNSGSAALGRAQLSANAALDNPLGLNDIVSLSLSSNAEHVQASHRSQSAGINYTIPWGYNTFSASASASRFAQTVQGTTVNFLSSGTSCSQSLRWDRTVLRTSSAKGGLYADLSSRRAQSYIDDTELVVQRRRTTQIETGVSWRQLFEQSSLDVSLGLRRGMPWNSAQDDLPTAATGGLTLRPQLWLLNASYDTAVPWFKDLPLAYSLNLRGQSTHQQTLSIDQIAIGGRGSVRGFDGDSVLLGESGLIARNELSTPAAALTAWTGSPASWLLAFDYGRVWGPSAGGLVGNKLAGLAVGARVRGKALQLDFTLGTPLYAPAGFKTRRVNAYVSTTYVF